MIGLACQPWKNIIGRYSPGSLNTPRGQGLVVWNSCLRGTIKFEEVNRGKCEGIVYVAPLNLKK